MRQCCRSARPSSQQVFVYTKVFMLRFMSLTKCSMQEAMQDRRWKLDVAAMLQRSYLGSDRLHISRKSCTSIDEQRNSRRLRMSIISTAVSSFRNQPLYRRLRTGGRNAISEADATSHEGCLPQNEKRCKTENCCKNEKRLS